MMQQPGFYRRRVGGITVTALNDGTLELPLAALVGIEPDRATALLAARFRPPVPLATVNAYLIEAPGRTILLDTGGGGMAPSTGRLLGNLAAAGVAPGAIDLVLLTHLHSDHSGMLALDGAAVFPNAELGLPESEAAYWLDDAAMQAAPEARRPSFAAARAATAPYRGRTRLLPAGAVAPGVTLLPLPGHTPGHSGYRIDDAGDSLLIWGDVMHVPEVQGPHPEIGMTYDIDLARARDTRCRVLDMAAADRLAVAGMHLAFPGIAHVARLGTGFELIPETWSPDA